MSTNQILRRNEPSKTLQKVVGCKAQSEFDDKENQILCDENSCKNKQDFNVVHMIQSQNQKIEALEHENLNLRQYVRKLVKYLNNFIYFLIRNSVQCKATHFPLLKICLICKYV